MTKQRRATIGSPERRGVALPGSEGLKEPEALVRKAVSVVSPLRYPGGKRRLSGYVAAALKLNKLKPKLFVEPFAGGASVALQLLADGVVEKIALGDRDPLVASFWNVVFHDHKWLVEQVENISVTIKDWERTRKSLPKLKTDRERALACLFLNRTSFSGILAATAGPIGGKEQASEYKVDCRFPRETLVRRIKAVAELRNDVAFISRGTWRETMKKVGEKGYKPADVFYYLDPPFYAKAERLYRFYFKKPGHTALHDAFVKVKSPWLLSYDVAQTIIDQYSQNGHGPKQIDLLYSITGSSGLSSAQEVIISNLAKLPTETRLWRSSREWRPGRGDETAKATESGSRSSTKQ
jgi:DNA adenine methylase